MTANREPAPSDDRRGPEVSGDASAQATTAPTAEQRADAAFAFLRVLRPSGPWVLTAIVPDGKTDTRTAETEGDVRLFVRRHDGSRNIYYHVNPTNRRLWSKASKEDMASAEFVHADLDPRDDETPEDAKARYMERLAVFDPRPTAVVDTGNGIQALWRLDAPVPPDRFGDVEAASAGVIAALGGDPGTHNVDRILRLPGTRNLPNRAKRERGRVECDAALLSFDGGAHPLDAFPAAEPPAARPRRSAEIIPLPPLPDHLRERAARSTGRGVSSDPDDMLTPVDVADVEAALAVIPSGKREIWYRVAAALHSAFDGSEEGFAIFDAWSQTTTRKNYFEARARKQWDNSAALTDIHIGSIFHLADKHDPDWRSAREPKKAEDTAQPSATAAPKQTPAASTGLRVRSLSSYEMEPVRWLWPNRFPLGKLSIIIGDPQEGKSQIAANIEARISRGNVWPNSEDVAPQGSIIVFAAEDGVADTIRPRFEAAGGDPSKVHVVEAVHLRERGGNRVRGFDLSTDLELLETEVRRIGDVRLVRFDPITAYMGAAGKIDSHNNTDVRAVLTAVSAFADRCRTTVLGISHLAKNSNAKAAVSAIGSVAFSAAARSVYVVVPDSENPGRRLFLRAKNNLAEAGGDGLAYRIKVKQVTPEIAAPVIEWASERVIITADEAMAAAKGGRGQGQARVTIWLRTVLSTGPRTADAMKREAEAAGFTEKMLRTARERIGVSVTKGQAKGAPWMWSLQEQQGVQEEMNLDRGGL